MTKGLTDVVKGRVEEAAGALTNNNKLRAKGQKDQAIGHVKQLAEDSVKKVKNEACKSVNKAKKIAKQVVDKAEGGA